MLSQIEVDEIRTLLASGVNKCRVARVLGINRSTVRNIAANRPTTFVRKLERNPMRKLSQEEERKLYDTRLLSIAESAGACRKTQDFVRLWRRKNGYHQRRSAAPRYALELNDRVMWYDRHCGKERIGRIIEQDGTRHHVQFDDGDRRWLGEQALAFHPTPEEIAERAAAIAAQWPADHHNLRQQFFPVEPHEWHVYDSGVDRVL